MTEQDGTANGPVTPPEAGLAPEVAAAESGDAVVRRTKDGWRVGGSEVPDLTSAMVLADLISAELSADEAASASPAARRSGRPGRPGRQVTQAPPAEGVGGRARAAGCARPLASSSMR